MPGPRQLAVAPDVLADVLGKNQRHRARRLHASLEPEGHQRVGRRVAIPDLDGGSPLAQQSFRPGEHQRAQIVVRRRGIRLRGDQRSLDRPRQLDETGVADLDRAPAYESERCARDPDVERPQAINGKVMGCATPQPLDEVGILARELRVLGAQYLAAVIIVGCACHGWRRPLSTWRSPRTGWPSGSRPRT